MFSKTFFGPANQMVLPAKIMFSNSRCLNAGAHRCEGAAEHAHVRVLHRGQGRGQRHWRQFPDESPEPARGRLRGARFRGLVPQEHLRVVHPADVLVPDTAMGGEFQIYGPV